MYIIFKTTEEQIIKCGSVFEAVRGHWVLNPENAKQCTKVVAVVNKVIKEVFTADNWYESTLCHGRYVFSGERDEELSLQLVGKQLNPELCIKGAENPVRYCQPDDLLGE